MTATAMRAGAAQLRTLPYVPFRWSQAVEAIAEDLPGTLVSSDAAHRVLSFAKNVEAMWHWGMFEVRLADNSPQVDLLSCIFQDEDARACLLDALTRSHYPALQPVGQTLTAWASSEPLRSTPNLWLEWDMDREHNAPLMWLCTAPDFFDGSRRPLEPAQIGELADAFMATNHDLRVDGASAMLAELAGSLPSGGKVMSFASLRNRGRARCKAFVCLPHGSTSGWLDSIGWRGDRRLLASLGTMLPDADEREWCQVEFDSRLRRGVGLELTQTERGFRHRHTRARWLEEAVARGWASPDKASSVMRWHGSRTCTLGPGDVRTLHRSFHLKLSVAEDSAPVAKAYLGFYFRRNKGECRLM